MSWYLMAVTKYATFSGRARRKEYWMFFLVNIIISFVLGLIMGFFKAATGIDLSFVSILYALALILPSIAVGVRRMHDTDRSGWWLIVPIAGFIFLFFEGQPNENRFGPDPKAT